MKTAMQTVLTSREILATEGGISSATRREAGRCRSHTAVTNEAASVRASKSAAPRSRERATAH